MEEGYYLLRSPSEPEPVLVHGYFCSDMAGAFVFGFNTYDGGGLISMDDISSDTLVTKVKIEEFN